jgi:hypothetical protein
MCEDAVNRDSTCQSIFKRLCTANKIEDFRFLVSRPDEVSSRPDAHLSSVPSVLTTCSFCPDTSLCQEGSIRFASVRTFQQHVRTPLGTRPVSDSFQVLIT